MQRIRICFLLFFGYVSFAFGQDSGKFDNDIQTILNYDKIYKAPENAILFVGSSSIRKWDDLQETFGNYNVLNRGIGGAVINDITGYLNTIVFPYHPRQIVLYVGENDVPQKEETPDTILYRTIRLYQLIREKLPQVPIIYISLKPSPVRDQFKQKAIATNKLLQKFFSGEKGVVFLDVFPLMLTPEGNYRKDLFQSDMLHMNRQGYAIWEKAIQPYLFQK